LSLLASRLIGRIVAGKPSAKRTEDGQERLAKHLLALPSLLVFVVLQLFPGLGIALAKFGAVARLDAGQQYNAG